MKVLKKSLTWFPFVAWIPLTIWGLLYGLGIIPISETVFTTVLIILVAFIFVPVIFMAVSPMLSFFGGSPTTRRILREGRSADAVIKGISESSQGGVITVNDQPYVNIQLEVHDSYQAPYLTNVDTIIPRTALPQFQPGVVLPIKIDPQDPMKIAIDWGRGAGV